MYPSSQTNTRKFCCERSTCPKRREHMRSTSLQTSSVEEIDQKIYKLNEETQVSSSLTVTTSSSEKNSIPDSEYEIMCNCYRAQLKEEEINSDINRIQQKMENACVFKHELKHLSRFYNSCNSNKGKCRNSIPNCKHQRIPNLETIYIEIPLEIHLKTTCSETQRCIEEKLPSEKKSTTSAAIQTSKISIFENGYLPDCWCTIQKSKECDCKDLLITTFVTQRREEERELLPSLPPSSPSPKTSITSVCKCENEKLSEEQYEELMEKPDAKLFSLICENKQKCACDLEKPKTSTEVEKKFYRLAYPQHKDLDVCIKCRFEPSPLIDENNTVFCPGKCGCCLCPWKPPARASLDDVLLHRKIKICKCRNRFSLFEGITKYDSACSQVSYFDICPCREKAEAKFLELYGYEMRDHSKKQSKNKNVETVLLEDVREIRKKVKKETTNVPNLLFKDD